MRKSEDTRNYRKGAELATGDIVEMVRMTSEGRVDYSAGREFKIVASIAKEDGQYRLDDETGTWSALVAGHQFAKGQF